MYGLPCNIKSFQFDPQKRITLCCTSNLLHQRRSINNQLQKKYVIFLHTVVKRTIDYVQSRKLTAFFLTLFSFVFKYIFDICNSWKYAVTKYKYGLYGIIGQSISAFEVLIADSKDFPDTRFDVVGRAANPSLTSTSQKIEKKLGLSCAKLSSSWAS